MYAYIYIFIYRWAIQYYMKNVETRAYESLKNVLANLAVVFQNLQAQQNFHWPWPVSRGLS